MCDPTALFSLLKAPLTLTSGMRTTKYSVFHKYFNCLFCVHCVIYIVLYVKKKNALQIHMFIWGVEERESTERRDRGQLSRCYLTAAVCPAWCMGRRYDRDFAYTV